mmetsp:Transcript_63792/g.177376  ORF Transcript_63792/g.177376 Transcript_63792/m.177376 type:complete len:243 (-) Transcript_63792:96-824(-)
MRIFVSPFSSCARRHRVAGTVGQSPGSACIAVEADAVCSASHISCLGDMALDLFSMNGSPSSSLKKCGTQRAKSSSQRSAFGCNSGGGTSAGGCFTAACVLRGGGGGGQDGLIGIEEPISAAAAPVDVAFTSPRNGGGGLAYVCKLFGGGGGGEGKCNANGLTSSANFKGPSAAGIKGSVPPSSFLGSSSSLTLDANSMLCMQAISMGKLPPCKRGMQSGASPKAGGTTKRPDQVVTLAQNN